ncbi:Hydrolase [Ralstonia mannitolilytica]|uniref:lecithin retinol acyltransferase family protein n=1 Tax=Ralstonia mannitolilytica TaxID=105219 RepID=UPI0028F615DC|nr:lecithin retinol acyltransferase family protein [Ralstonia mannitolilytica]CAJ0793627.1 hypothetical protein R77555_02517 [Ralstonia mannitolilytica]
MTGSVEDIPQWNERYEAAAFAAEPALGAHLVVQRNGYQHHGIYVGNGHVVHYAGFSRGQRRGPVERISITCFALGFSVTVNRDANPRYDGAEVARRALSRLGERDYRLLTNNCEHFCSWCLFGECRSKQVEACAKNPVQAVRTLFMLMRLALSIERQAAELQPQAA